MKDQRGFTLIELLCALAILALVLGVSLRIMAGSSASAAAGRDYGRILAVAQAHLIAIETSEHVVPGERHGEGWSERAVRAEEPAFAGAAALGVLAWRLEATATSPDGRRVTLTSVRLEPIR
jgi:prepilin-type N-terminal cleavage/methylation domain-containing protein